MDPDEIRHLRAKTRLNQRDFGKLLDTTHGTVGRWEKGDAEPSNLQAAVLAWIDRLMERTDRGDREWKSKKMVAQAERDMEQFLSDLYSEARAPRVG